MTLPTFNLLDGDEYTLSGNVPDLPAVWHEYTDAPACAECAAKDKRIKELEAHISDLLQAHAEYKLETVAATRRAEQAEEAHAGASILARAERTRWADEHQHANALEAHITRLTALLRKTRGCLRAAADCHFEDVTAEIDGVLEAKA